MVIVDPTGSILWLNAAWSRFADENQGTEIAQRFGVGTNYFGGISGPLREFFVDMFAQALRTLRPSELDYECSSPSARIMMRLRVLPVQNAGLLLEHTRVSEQPFPEGPCGEPAPHFVNEHGLISQCSNCRKVRRTDSREWEWVPRWVAAPLPNISHGLCDICYGFYWKARSPV